MSPREYMSSYVSAKRLGISDMLLPDRLKRELWKSGSSLDAMLASH